MSNASRKKLPDGWATPKLKEVAILAGRIGWKGLTAKEYTGSGPFFLSVHSLNYGDYVDFRDAFHISQERYDESPEIMLQPDDVLICKDGAGIGKVGIIGDLPGPSTINSSLLLIRAEEKVRPKYLYYLLLSPYFQHIVQSRLEGATTPHLYQRDIKEFPVRLPEPSVQKRIVAILDDVFERIDTAIANTEKNLANARELFESYLNNIFTQKGEGWVTMKLGELCSIKHGFAFKSKFFQPDGEYIVLTPGSFYESGGFRDQGKKTKYYEGEIPDGFILQKDDFLFAMTEQAKGLLGSSLIVPESDRYLHNQRLGLVQPFEGAVWHNQFFHFQFNTKFFREAVQETASGVKVRHTSPKKLLAIPVSFPKTLSEQDGLASELAELKSKTMALEVLYQRKLDALNELKQSILQKAFSGEL